MPQMSPMYWLSLLLFFILIMMFLMTFIYFYYFNIFKSDNVKLNILSFDWSW
uniref:ATP synthase F0 subunit 8 n=1 Tax=Babras sonorivox TaxID=2219942 RepID=A0A3S7MG92_9HEMI|nr:ATP synthase F0 subunit 8 [Babras sonorivox]